MKKVLFSLLLLSVVCVARAQEVTNRYSMKLEVNGDGTYSLINAKRYAAIVDLDKIPDLLVPYTYSFDRLKASDYSKVETREFVYKSYPDYELKLQVDMAVSDTPAPFMVYIHGGGWARGTFSSNSDLSKYAARQAGVAGVRISYTLAPQPGATVFVSIEDVKDAVKFIQDHAAELNIDPARFGFCGGSAGGHLAAVGAMSIPGARLVISYAGIYDLEHAAISSKISKSNTERMKYFCDATPDVLRKASPVNMIPSKNIPAALLIHGSADIVVECGQSRIFAEALRKKGAADVELSIYPYYDHNISSKTSDLKEKCFFDSYEFIKKHIF